MIISLHNDEPVDDHRGLQTRLIAGCATANKIDSQALPEGIETAALRR